MPPKNTGAGKPAKNKNKGVRGPPRYATNPTGTIKTRNQDTRDALSAVMSQLREKSGQKFLPDAAPDDGASAPLGGDTKPLPPPPSPPSDGSDKSDDSLGLDKEVSRSLTGSRRPDVADSVTKRRSQMGLADTDSASDTSLKKLWDNGGDIASRSYAEREVERRGVTFPASDEDNGCKNQFVIVHKRIDALQEECTLFNRDVSHHLDHCESATHDLSGRLLGGLGDMNTKLSELTIDDMFVKTLQQGVESTRSNLEEFKKVYTSFREKAFAPLLGNVDANSLCVNELVKDVTSTRGDVRSLTQKVQKLNQTLSLLEKGTGSGSPKLRSDLSSSQTKSLGSDDSCSEGVIPGSQRRGSLGTDRTDASHNITQTIDTLRDSVSNLEIRVTHVETQCKQSVARAESTSDDVCCGACAKVADGLSMNTRNVNTLYNALLSTGLLTDKVSGDLITNFRDGRQVVGPLFSTPSEPKGKNGIISFASPINVHPRGSSMGVNKTIGNLRVDETLSETNDMGVNKKVYEEQLKLIPVFNGEDTSKFRPWIKRIEKSVNSGFYNPHRVCHLKAEGAVESFISKHLHEDWDSLKAKLRTRFSDLRTTQDCVKAVRGCKQGK